MSIFGNTKAERRGIVRGDLQVCPECGYDGQDCNPEVDVCGSCGKTTHAGGDDMCEHCGDSNCLMQACPECEAQLEIDYERMEPIWAARCGFRRFECAVVGATNEQP